MLNRIITVLKNEKNPRWQTAKGICKKLQFNKKQVHQVEELLIRYHTETSEPVIRYSSLPSKNSLEVLWGHIDKVGNRELFDIYKEDDALIVDYLKDIPDTRNIFLSYSFKDTAKVLSLAHKLVKIGLYPWIAQVDLYRDQQINSEVINALLDVPHFGIYLSSNVLESAWSAKEFQYAINHDKKLYAFVEETDTLLIDLIKDTALNEQLDICLLYTSPSPRDLSTSRMPSSA